MSLNIKAMTWCVVFAISGPLLIILNNHIYNNLMLQYPITISSLGVWGSLFIGHVCVKTGLWRVNQRMTLSQWTFQIIPVALCSALTMVLGNAVYMHLSVSFTQMLKALSPAYIVLMMCLFKLRPPTSLSSVGVICLGTAIAAFGELKFSLVGVLLQSCAEMMEATKVVLLQKMMGSDKLTPKEAIYYIYPVTGFIQLILAVVFERSIFSDASVAIILKSWYVFIAAVILGFIVNFAGSAVIQLTSGLTFKLIGIVRNNMLLLISLVILGDNTTLIQVVGYVISAIGFATYTLSELPQKSQRPID